MAPNNILRTLPLAAARRLCERFCADLPRVHAFTGALLGFELAHRLYGTKGWDLIIARNKWFQRNALNELISWGRKCDPHRSDVPTLFSYSYTALEMFRYAKTQGWHCVLGQIDSGPAEDEIVRDEHTRQLGWSSNWQPAPAAYWAEWREECTLADQIMVNSPWASQALQQSGLPQSKITIIPLAYAPQILKTPPKIYPIRFTATRPLRVLFLGQATLGKGVARLIEAAEALRLEPVEFSIVGPVKVQRLGDNRFGGSVSWLGTVPRSAVARHYQWADVFVLPSLSDGFGLTQLEAQAWRVPVIASTFCGAVVRDKVNGIILPEPSALEIVRALRYFLEQPEQLQAFSDASGVEPEFQIPFFSRRLLELSPN